MPRTMTIPTTAPHPLEGVVLASFRDRSAHDRITLAPVLCGTGDVSNGGTRAYIKVAEDVLGYMASQGKLVVDDFGWYRLPQSSNDLVWVSGIMSWVRASAVPPHLLESMHRRPDPHPDLGEPFLDLLVE